MVRFLLLGIVGAALVGCTATPIPIPYDEFRVLGETAPTDTIFSLDLPDLWTSGGDAVDPLPDFGPPPTDAPPQDLPDAADGPPPDIPDAADGPLPDIPDAGPPEVDAGADAADGSPEAG